MGADLYAEVIGADKLDVPCRVYAPVGSHEDLLPYLVRRLLENGANTSFVNRIVDDARAGARASSPILRDGRAPSPRARTRASPCRSTSIGDRPDEFHGRQHRQRRRPRGPSPTPSTRQLAPWTARAPGRRRGTTGAEVAVTDPADRRRVIGHWQAADAAHRRARTDQRGAAQPGWDRLPAAESRARSSSALPTCSRHAAPSSSRCACAKPARRWPTPSPRCARRSISCATTPPWRAACSPRPQPLPGPTGERNALRAARPRRLRLHQPVELPAGDLLGQVARGARRRQCGDRQARRADHA